MNLYIKNGRFYINYVVCKLVTPFVLVLLGDGFILTMWYVNLSNTRDFLFLGLVLY